MKMIHVSGEQLLTWFRESSEGMELRDITFDCQE